MVLCMEEKILLFSPNCVGCRELKERLTRMGTIDKYKIVDVSTGYGKELVQKLGLTSVPSCVVVRKTPAGAEARVCSSKEFLEVIKDQAV